MVYKPDGTDVILRKTLVTEYMFDEHNALLERGEVLVNKLFSVAEGISALEEDCMGRSSVRIPEVFIERFQNMIQEYNNIIESRREAWTNVYEETVE